MPTTTPAPARLLVIRERDCGLFSMVWQVLNTMLLVEDAPINRIPVVVAGRGSVYFQASGYQGRRTVWEYYFEPVVADWSAERVLNLLGAHPLDLLESKRRQLEHERGAIEFPDAVNGLLPITDDDRRNLAALDANGAAAEWAWTDSFAPLVDGERAKCNATRERAATLVRRYIRPRAYIRRQALDLFDALLFGSYVIGVHVRGTDSGFEINFDRYFRAIETRRALVGSASCRLFLATDEAYVLDRFEEHFGDRLVHSHAVRSAQGEPRAGLGPTGGLVPGYIAKGGLVASANGADAVLEYSLLCQCHYLVHNGSGLATAASLLVADSVAV